MRQTLGRLELDDLRLEVGAGAALGVELDLRRVRKSQREFPNQKRLFRIHSFIAFILGRTEQ